MKRLMLSTLVLVLAVLPAAADEVRTLKEEFPLEPAQTIRLDLPIGRLEVEGTEGDRAEVVVDVECRRRRRRCEEALEDIRLSSSTRKNKLVLEIEGYPKWGRGLSIDVAAAIPHGNALEIDMGIGAIEIEGLENDLSIDLGIGEVEVLMEEAAVRAVNLDIGIGASSLDLPDGHFEGTRFLLGNEIEWAQGNGSANIEIDLGIGEVDVDLD